MRKKTKKFKINNPKHLIVIRRSKYNSKTNKVSNLLINNSLKTRLTKKQKRNYNSLRKTKSNQLKKSLLNNQRPNQNNKNQRNPKILKAKSKNSRISNTVFSRFRSTNTRWPH